MTTRHEMTDTHNKRPKGVILAVDDDANNLAVIRDCLTGFNYSVLAAEDGESAVKRAAYACPDLILLDMMMPGMDGYETCRKLKSQENSKDIPVIFMSAMADTGHRVRGLEAGAVDYITKPFNQDELLARIAVHVNIRELSRRLKEANDQLESRVEERTRDLEEANLRLKNEIAEKMEAQEQLRQSQKMEAVGTLAGAVAHDFNNILTLIMGLGGIMREKLDGNDALLAHYADDILSAAEKAANLTRSLLAFSRKQIIEPGPENVNELVSSIENILLRVLGENIKLNCTLAPEQLMIMADGMQIEQVLMNLAINARDAMPDGGTLTFETTNFEITEEAGPTFLRPGSYVRITVSDTGCGIDEKILPKIYEPFFTTKETGKGTGLGLSIVYGIIKQHGGEVTVESKVGKGATFHIFLPLLLSEEVQQHTESSVPVTGGTETILLAEDDDAVRGYMSQVLKNYGYDVIEAIDGEDALSKYNAGKNRIQLILMDVGMPKLSGREVHAKIKAGGGQVRVLYLTGYAPDMIEHNWTPEKDVSFMTKPVNIQTLLKKIRAALDYA